MMANPIQVNVPGTMGGVPRVSPTQVNNKGKKTNT